MATIACLHCNSENVQKVSAVYNAGVSQTKTDGHKFGTVKDEKGKRHITVEPYSETHSHKTQLAEMLTPPSKPVNMAVGFALLALLAVLGAGWLVTNYWLIGTFGQTLGVLAGLLMTYWIGKSVWRSMRQVEANERVKFEAALKEWERAMQRWEGLYYCAKCDRVFDPERKESAPTAQMRTLL